MILGLGSYTFRWSIGHKGLNPETPLQPEDLLDIAANHGLKVVQYADNMPLSPLSDEALASLNSKALALGISIEVGIQSFDTDELIRYIAIAEKLNARIVRVALDGEDSDKPITQLAAEFAENLPLAKAANVRIAIENHFNFPTPQMVELLKAIDSEQVGVCLDVANSICAGEWPMETVNTLAPHTINLHLKDYAIVPDAYGVGFAIYGTPLGDGRTDGDKVLAALPKDDNMSVILEHWLPRSDDMSDACAQEHVWLAKSVAYARTQLGL